MKPEQDNKDLLERAKLLLGEAKVEGFMAKVKTAADAEFAKIKKDMTDEERENTRRVVFVETGYKLLRPYIINATTQTQWEKMKTPGYWVDKGITVGGVVLAGAGAIVLATKLSGKAESQGETTQAPEALAEVPPQSHDEIWSASPRKRNQKLEAAL